MTKMPATFPTQNSHRIVVHQSDLRGTDFERVEDLAADAVAAARGAIRDAEDLPYDAFKPVEQALADLASAVERRRVQNDEFRLAAETALQGLARVEPAEPDAAAFDRVRRRLRDALNLSHRVADLIAAERDIGWLRRLGR